MMASSYAFTAIFHDLLTTLIGTRLCRRHYGSLVPDLIDHPCNDFTKLKIMNASATAGPF
jgi:phage baseplate assembly protein W